MTQLEGLALRMNPQPEGPVLIGLSGGADSVALTRLMLLGRDRGQVRPEAVHVNHGLRGEESDRDEQFVRNICREWEIPLHVERAELSGRTDENTAREARYLAFRKAMADSGIFTLALAHQREDQAETFLMHLMRGAGPEGLGGMKPAEDRDGYRLIRPLLDISGAELRNALREDGTPWREDGSNRDGRYFRNRIRNELLPRMEEMMPGSAGRIARTAELIRRDNEALEMAAEKIEEAAQESPGMKILPLAGAPEAVRSRVLRQWWRREGPEREERQLSFEQTRRLESLLDAPRGTIINLPGGWRARREKDHLRLMDPTDRTRNNRPRGGKRNEHD